MAQSAIKIEGLDRLQGKLRNLEDLKGVKTAMRAAAVHVKGEIAKYPPASEANRPNEQGRWYERGYGPRWLGGGKKTSETLGRKWTVAERDQGLTQIVGNNVSYGPFVQDPDKQAAWHKKGYKGREGFKTTDQVASEENDTVNDFIKKEVDRVLRR